MINPLVIINQVFELQEKIREKGLADEFSRNFTRLLAVFEEDGYLVQNPTGESYSETRSDYEASINGSIGQKMKISRTIKPIIYQKRDGSVTLLQKGVVIAENQ